MVSQFTLYGDARKGRRPSWTAAADPERRGRAWWRPSPWPSRPRACRVGRGVFGADMEVELRNDGPVTLILDADLL